MVKYGTLFFSEHWEGGETKEVTHDKKKCRQWEYEKTLFDGSLTLVTYNVYTHESINPMSRVLDGVKFNWRMKCKRCGAIDSKEDACEGTFKEVTFKEDWTCVCGLNRQVITSFKNAHMFANVAAVLDWIPLAGTAARAGAFASEKLQEDGGDEIIAEAQLSLAKRNLASDAFGMVTAGAAGPLGNAAAKVAPAAAPLVQGTAQVATVAGNKIGNHVFMRGGGLAAAQLAGHTTTEVTARTGQHLFVTVLDSGTEGERQRHDFGGLSWDTCYRCRVPVGNKGCKECGLRFCASCFNGNHCGCMPSPVVAHAD